MGRVRARCGQGRCTRAQRRAARRRWRADLPPSHFTACSRPAPPTPPSQSTDTRVRSGWRGERGVGSARRGREGGRKARSDCFFRRMQHVCRGRPRRPPQSARLTLGSSRACEKPLRVWREGSGREALRHVGNADDKTTSARVTKKRRRRTQKRGHQALSPRLCCTTRWQRGGGGLGVLQWRTGKEWGSFSFRAHRFLLFLRPKHPPFSHHAHPPRQP